MRRHLIILLAIASLCRPVAAAGNGGDAGDFLKNRLDAVIAVLRTPGLDDADKRERAVGIIMPVFDMPLMAKLAVGKEFWPRFSDAQQERFTAAFTRRLQQLYIGKIMQYTDERVVFGSTEVEGVKARIPTELISSGSRYAILYKMYRSGEEWKIYDIELDRVSILKSFRSQTSQVLSGGTFQELIEKLESPPREES